MTYKQHAKYIGSLTVSDANVILAIGPGGLQKAGANLKIMAERHANGDFDPGRDAQDIDTIMFFADAVQIAACIAELPTRIHESEIEYMAAGAKRKSEISDRLQRLRALRPSSAALSVEVA